MCIIYWNHINKNIVSNLCLWNINGSLTKPKLSQQPYGGQRHCIFRVFNSSVMFADSALLRGVLGSDYLKVVFVLCRLHLRSLFMMATDYASGPILLSSRGRLLGEKLGSSRIEILLIDSVIYFEPRLVDTDSCKVVLLHLFINTLFLGPVL